MCGFIHFCKPSAGHFDEIFHTSLYEEQTFLHSQVASMDPLNSVRQEAMRRREKEAMMLLALGCRVFVVNLLLIS